MLVTKQWIEKNYNKFNDELFDGRLPNIKFKVNKTCKSWGLASYLFDYKNDTIIPESITISNYYDSPEYVKIQTLLHEMIHIADYTFHPEHFFKNGRKISSRRYDAHGYWFNQEAQRISKESGYTVTNHVTSEESKASSLSNSVRMTNERRVNKALLCAVFGETGIWWFKTDIDKVNHLKKNLKKMYNWSLTIGEFKEIKFYTFENKAFASRRSCCNRITGWRTSKLGFTNILKKFNAIEVFV